MADLEDRIKFNLQKQWEMEGKPFLEAIVLPALEEAVDVQGWDKTALKADLGNLRKFEPRQDLGADSVDKFIYLAYRCIAKLNMDGFPYKLRIQDHWIIGELREDWPHAFTSQPK